MRSLELGQYIRIGKGEEVTGGRDKNSLLADSLEALIGAIYLSEGFETSQRVVRDLIRDTLASAMNRGAGLDGKTALQELAAARKLNPPEYRIEESGPDHDKTFVATAVVGGEKVATGEGKGPVNAIDIALRSGLEKIYPELAKLELTDYKVRILEGRLGTSAVTRVLIETSDGETQWNTVGVHENIIAASAMALEDAVTYGLLRQGRKPE